MEIWKDIKGYPDYLISNFGRVKSFKRGKEKVLKFCFDNYGYHVVSLYKNNIRKTCKIHQIVAEHFMNFKPCGYKLVINHKNFIRTDNRVCNLEIVSQRSNTNKKHLKSSSKYVGVAYYKITSKWASGIFINGKRKHLGYYKTELEAHLAYQKELVNLTQKD